MRSDAGTRVSATSSDQSHMIGKFLIFFEDGTPRDTMFTEEAVYTVTGIKGSQRMLIEPAYLPFKAEIKNRTSCLPGSHIAWITDSKEKAVQIVTIITKLKRDVDKLGDFATTAINGFTDKASMEKTAPAYAKAGDQPASTEPVNEAEVITGQTLVSTHDEGPSIPVAVIPTRTRTRVVPEPLKPTSNLDAGSIPVRTRTRNVAI